MSLPNKSNLFSKYLSEFQVQPSNRLQLLKANRLKDHALLEHELLQDLRRLNKTKPTMLDFDLRIVNLIRGQFPWRLGIFQEALDPHKAIVDMSGLYFTMPIHTFVDPKLLQPDGEVLISPMLGIIGGLQFKEEEAALLNKTLMIEAPTDTFEDIGGLDTQIQELRECIDWPLNNSEIFEEMGIDPPRGVLLYGKPGCGKTLLARAVANSAKASFFHLSASQLIQKYLGEGPKMVRNIFKLAAEKAPSIIFIDEIDAIGTKRFSNQSSGENEVQRTMIELLARLVLQPLLS